MTPNDVSVIADNIDDFIELPNGIERLREALLTIAVSGKLVAQDRKEGTAEDLYKIIQKERIKEVGGRKRKDFSASPITAGEISFEIPKSWMWVRLGDIVRVDNGYSFKSSKYVESGTRVIRITNVQNGFIADNNPKFISEEDGDEFAGFQLHVDDLLMSLTGYVGRVAMFPSTMLPAVLNQRVARIVPFMDDLKPYIFTYFQSGFFRAIAASSTRGMAQQNMSTEWLKTHPIPMPPLSEQGRIVEKVEEVMEQLVKLAAKKQERDEVRARFTRSAMQSLGKGESGIAFKHLAELIKTLDDVKEFEDALLTLAVSGQLVLQDRKEGTADETKQVKEVSGRKRKAKVFSEITPKEVSFGIPKNWKWVRLGSAFIDYGSGSTPSRGNDGFYKDGHTNWYKSGELNDGILFADSEEKITDSALEKCHLRLNKRGDLLIAMYGATAGRVAMLDNEGTTNQAVWGGTPDSFVDVKFLFLYLLQSRYQLLKTSSGAAQPNISGEKIAAHVLPLPPLAEQKRIIKKVEEVMVLIDRLKPLVAKE
jgi:type I restriction enzyme S subunit